MEVSCYLKRDTNDHAAQPCAAVNAGIALLFQSARLVAAVVGSLGGISRSAMKLSAVCDVLRNTKQPVYYLQPYCVDRKTGIYTNLRGLITFSDVQMREQGLERVMAELREFPSRDIAHRSVPDTKTPAGKRDAKASRESVPVLVRLLPVDAIEFTPCAKFSRAAWIHLTDRTVVLQQPTTPEAFFQTLSDAFDRCIPEPE